MNINLKNMWIILAISVFLSANIWAQETTGEIEGTVKDQNGSAVSGILIRIRTKNNSATTTGAFNQSIKTDQNGYYKILQVPPNFYTISTEESQGFGATSTNNVEVTLGKATVVNLTLAVKGQTNIVNVSADNAAIIDPSSNKAQSNLTSRFIESAPKGTNFSGILQTAPSVRNEPLSGGFQIDGASGSENIFIVDGQEINNFRTGILNINNDLPFQFIQEIAIKSGGFEAEFGGATGGVVSIATKSGGNDFHGEIGLSLMPAKFQSAPRPFLNLLAIPATSTLSELRTTQYLFPKKDGGNSFFPSFTLSAPILKNRIWFFGSYTPQIIKIERNLNYIDPDPRISTITATENYRQNIKQEYAFGRIDVQPFDSLRLTGTYTWSPRTQIGTPDDFENMISAPPTITFPNSGEISGADYLNKVGGRQNSNNTNGALVWTPNSKLVITARGGYSFLNEKIGNYGVPSVAGQTRYFVSDFSTDAAPANFGLQIGQQNFPAFSQKEYDVSRRRTFDADASFLVSNPFGKHQFKGGYQFNGITNIVQKVNVDSVIFSFGDTIATLTGRNVATNPATIGAGWIERSGVVGAAGSNNQALYIQDSWGIANRLILNVGVRIERENSPSFTAAAPGIKFGWGDKVAPRLGFAFDLFRDGKTKIYSSYGRFFDRFKYELPRGLFGGNLFRNDYFEIFAGQTLANFTRQSIIGTNPDLIGGNCPIANSSGFSRCQLSLTPANLPGNTLNLGAIDPDIKAFQQSEYTIGIERNFSRGYFFGGRLTRKQVDVVVEDSGFIASTGSEAYIIGNPGRGLALAQSKAGGFLPLQPVRNYTAAEFRLSKRFSDSGYFDASYTLSRLFGNYSGLANSDEGGRTSPNVNRNFDLPFIGFSGLGKPDNGNLPTDRPHSFKLSGSYNLNWRKNNSTEISGFTMAQSGTPVTTRFTFYGVANQILNGRGDLGRTQIFTQTDLAVRHKYRFGADNRFTLAFEMDVLNLFNEANELQRFETITSASINFDDGDIPLVTDFVSGFQLFQTENTANRINAFLKANPDRLDPRYNQPIVYQTGRSVRFGVRFMF